MSDTKTRWADNLNDEQRAALDDAMDSRVCIDATMARLRAAFAAWQEASK